MMSQSLWLNNKIEVHELHQFSSTLMIGRNAYRIVLESHEDERVTCRISSPIFGGEQWKCNVDVPLSEFQAVSEALESDSHAFWLGQNAENTANLIYQDGVQSEVCLGPKTQTMISALCLKQISLARDEIERRRILGKLQVCRERVPNSYLTRMVEKEALMKGIITQGNSPKGKVNLD